MTFSMSTLFTYPAMVCLKVLLVMRGPTTLPVEKNCRILGFNCCNIPKHKLQRRSSVDGVVAPVALETLLLLEDADDDNNIEDGCSVLLLLIIVLVVVLVDNNDVDVVVDVDRMLVEITFVAAAATLLILTMRIP